MTGGSWREHLAAIRPDADPAEAEWWDTEWGPGTPPAVGFVIPRGFQAYARVLHPARDTESREVTWAEVARESGTTLHPEAQWHRLAGRASSHDHGPPHGTGWAGENPREGVLERSLFASLVEVLARHTSTPDDTVVAFWDGYGAWPSSWRDLPVARQPGRDHYLFRRPLGDVERLCAEAPAVRWAVEPGHQHVVTFSSDGRTHERPSDDELLATFATSEWQSPSEWWPADRAWATSNDTDLDSTLVGGSSALVDDLLADERLEALPWPLDGSLWADADTVNR